MTDLTVGLPKASVVVFLVPPPILSYHQQHSVTVPTPLLCPQDLFFAEGGTILTQCRKKQHETEMLLALCQKKQRAKSWMKHCWRLQPGHRPSLLQHF